MGRGGGQHFHRFWGRGPKRGAHSAYRVSDPTELIIRGGRKAVEKQVNKYLHIVSITPPPGCAPPLNPGALGTILASGMPLGVQWSRIYLRCRGRGFDPWSGNEDPTCLGATKPAGCNCRTRELWRPCSITGGACMLQRRPNAAKKPNSSLASM